MDIWLCPVKPRSWRIIKKERIFGAPTRVAKTMQLLKPGDLIVFHVLKPINGIVAICQVTSEVYEDYQEIRGERTLPPKSKNRICPVPSKRRSNPVPLSHVLGRNSSNGIQIEPYLKNIWITRSRKNNIKSLKIF